MNTYTTDEITEMANSWRNYNGFSGETCGKCQKTANVLAGGPGWICDCGHYNTQGIWGHSIPHEQPDMGTPLIIIDEGHKVAENAP